MTLQPLIKMHVLAAQGSEKKRGRHAYISHSWTCLASGIVMEIHCHITRICDPPMSSSLFSQCNFVMIFKSIVIPVRYHNKFPKFVCNVIDLCTT